MMKWIIAAVAFYGGVVALLYVAQRSLQYFPERRRTVPRAIGLPEAEEAVLDTADGERVIVWHVPPRRTASLSLFPWQWRFAALAGRALSRAHL
jgi:uncharacterized protein